MSILVARGNSIGVRQNLIRLVVSRVPYAWSCCAAGRQAIRERSGSVVCPLYGVDVLHRVVITVG
jgi:hypothetical protein